MPTVLLVDDEPSMRWTMGEFLKREGFETLVAADFDGALALFDGARVDAAVIDIVLPGKSGVELLHELRRRDPDLPIIMITGEPDMAQIPAIVRAGAYDYAPKPVVKDVLLKAVRRAVEKKKLTDEKRRLEAELKQYTEGLEARVAERTAELAAAHNFLHTVLDSSTEYAIIAADTERRIMLFNRGAELLFGYTAQEAGGTSTVELIQEAEQAVGTDGSLLAAMREAARGGRQQAQLRLRRADGSTFAASLIMTPIRQPEGELLGFLSVIRDITSELEQEAALRRMQERLFHSEKIAALGRVVAQVAHEVRNPLTGLLLYAMHLKSHAADKLAERERTLVDKIIDTVNHLAETVERLVNFARPVTLTLQRVDLNRVARRACELLQPQINANRIETHLALADEEVSGQLDEASLTSALINLMLNAVQAMPNGGRLSVTTGVTDAVIRLTIADTGCGMTAEQVENVFEPFYTTKSQGLGLGMSYAQKVIEQHGGTIRLTSRPGEGTQVLIELPAEKRED